ncbi:MAG: hypothetical protein B6245_20410 [Desulfobacteraceae bacterium 4572_88]|nr:MAG: hypothetical protein B6245_20410 [Desulfobacteraceae bacterium 4572_88]
MSSFKFFKLGKIIIKTSTLIRNSMVLSMKTVGSGRENSEKALLLVKTANNVYYFTWIMHRFWQVFNR